MADPASIWPSILVVDDEVINGGGVDVVLARGHSPGAGRHGAALLVF
jgi:hypothetical protein